MKVTSRNRVRRRSDRRRDLALPPQVRCTAVRLGESGGPLETVGHGKDLRRHHAEVMHALVTVCPAPEVDLGDRFEPSAVEGGEQRREFHAVADGNTDVREERAAYCPLAGERLDDTGEFGIAQRNQGPCDQLRYAATFGALERRRGRRPGRRTPSRGNVTGSLRSGPSSPVTKCVPHSVRSESMKTREVARR